MKHILKKDLPFAKIGAEVFSDMNPSKELNSDHNIACVKSEVSWLDEIIEIGGLRTLLDDGWIEEVKPREFFVNILKDSEKLFIYHDEDIAKRGHAPTEETIKVREVLE